MAIVENEVDISLTPHILVSPTMVTDGYIIAILLKIAYSIKVVRCSWAHQLPPILIPLRRPIF